VQIPTWDEIEQYDMEVRMKKAGSDAASAGTLSRHDSVSERAYPAPL
jgi:hypothetical protein